MSQNDSENDSGHENVPVVKKTYKARGMTVKRDLITQISKGGPKTHVDWNLKGQSYGPGHKVLSTFGGSKVKQVIPITINSWNEKGNKLLPKLKDDLWDMIKNCFDVEDSHRDTILSELAKIHRKWRADLAKKYIFDKEGNINLTPPIIYDGIISTEDWILFVKKHTEDPKFMALKKENQQKAKKVDYPYRAGSAGYAGVEAQLLEAQGKKPSEESVDRHILWLEARQNKAGQLIDPKTKEVAEKIENLSQSVNQGEIPDFDGEQDILARALEMEEYSGRMRGMGHGVVPSKVFKAKKRRSVPKCDNCEVYKKEQDDRYFELAKKIELLEAQNKASYHAPSPAPSSNAPFDAPSPMSVIDSHSFVLPTLPENIEIDLFILPPTHVASGFLCDQSGATLHTRPIPDGHVKVRVDVAFVGNAPLPIPIPNADIMIVAQAVGTFVLWPIHLIKPKEAPQPHYPKKTHSPKPSKKAPSPQPTSRDWIAFMRKKAELMNENEPVCVEFGKEICGVEGQYLIINRDDLSCVANNEWATNTAIRMYIRHLYHDLLVKRELEKKYCFLSPDNCAIIDVKKISKTKKEFTAATESMKAKIANYMTHRFLECCSQSDDVMFLAPINLKCVHWVLLAIDPKNDVVYYLDSLHWHFNTQTSLVIAVNNALTQYWALREDRTQFRKSANETKWVAINVPKQPNDSDCGYFVMQFMKEIVLNEQMTIPIDYFPHCKHKDYSKEILGIKRNCCRYADYLIRECKVALED